MRKFGREIREVSRERSRLEKQDVFETNDLFKPVTAMTTGVNGSTQQRLNPNQSVPALIPLDRPQTE